MMTSGSTTNARLVALLIVLGTQSLLVFQYLSWTRSETLRSLESRLEVQVSLMRELEQVEGDYDVLRLLRELGGQLVGDEEEGGGVKLRRRMSDLPTCTQQTRKAHLREACNHVNRDAAFDYYNSSTFERLMVDDEHRILYCVVPKAGCTSIKTLLSIKSGKANVKRLYEDVELVHDPAAMLSYGLYWLSDAPLSDLHHKLARYRKLLIVRHPLERLASAFHDKFVVNYDAWGSAYADVFDRAFPRRDAGAAFNLSQLMRVIVNDDAAFDEFRANVHWRDQFSLCHPCYIEYDYIAKLETIDADKRYILSLLNAVNLPHRNVLRKKPRQGQASDDDVTAALSDLSLDELRKLVEMYRKDLRLFGYRMDGVVGSACDIREITNGSLCC